MLSGSVRFTLYVLEEMFNYSADDSGSQTRMNWEKAYRIRQTCFFL